MNHPILIARFYDRIEQWWLPITRAEAALADQEELNNIELGPEEWILFRASNRSSLVEHLTPTGWDQWPHGGYMDLPGGNYFQVNNAGHAVGLMQGFMIGCVFAAVIAVLLFRLFIVWGV